MMKTTTIALLISCFAGSTASTETTESARADQRCMGKVVVLTEKVAIANDIKLLVNGELAATGDCQPRVKLGLMKRNALNGWDTLMDIHALGTLLCGFDRHKWSNDTISTSLLHYTLITPFKQGKEASGTYCFTYVAFKRGKSVMCTSNEFEIISQER
jgi:hypothetical protein